MNMKKITFASLAAAVALLSSGLDASAKTKVGVISWNDAEPRYSTTYKRMVEEVGKEGMGSEISFIMMDAKGKKDQIPELIKKLKEQKVDVYVPLGTSAAVPVANEIKDKPIVIGMVYDPVESKIAKDWKSSGNNLTGSSSHVSLPRFLRRLVKGSEGTFTIKRVAVPYTPGEKNSEIQLKAIQSAEAELGLQVTPVVVSKPEELNKWLKGLPGSADLIMVTGSNVISTHIGAIVDASIKAKIPTATHLDDLVERGVLFGLVADVDEVGTLAGKKLVQVAKGTEPSAIPIEAPSPKLIINQKTVQAGKFTIPPAIQQWATGAGS